MEFQEFPKWKYSQSKAVMVADAAAESALGAGWYDKPGEVPIAEENTVPSTAVSEPPALQDSGDPSAADLDAVAEESKVREITSKPKKWGK